MTKQNQLKEQIEEVIIEGIGAWEAEDPTAQAWMKQEILKLIHKRDEEIIQELEKKKELHSMDNLTLDEAIEVIRKYEK